MVDYENSPLRSSRVTWTDNSDSVRGASSGSGKSSLKSSKSFRIISSNQKLARAITSSSKTIARTNLPCCFATCGTNTVGSVESPRPDVAINWRLVSPNELGTIDNR